MGLAKIFQEIAERIPDGTTFAVGPEAVTRQDAPPRVVLVPTTEVFGPPRGQGGDGTARPRRLCTRSAEVSVHLWGKDREQTEELIELVLNVIQELAPGAHTRAGGAWIVENLAHRGVGYVFEVIFHIQVSRRESFASVGTLPTTGDFVETDEL